MASTCDLCGVEASIAGATGGQLAIGEKCYERLLKRGVGWTPETSKKELQRMVRKGNGRKERGA